TFPLYCTANGKAYLAELDEPAIERLIGRTYRARTPNTLTRIGDLIADLKGVKKKGVAFDREEHTLGICAAGVVLRDLLGNYVAISVPVPTQRFQEHQTAVVEALLATKRALEEHLTSTVA